MQVSKPRQSKPKGSRRRGKLGTRAHPINLRALVSPRWWAYTKRGPYIRCLCSGRRDSGTQAAQEVRAKDYEYAPDRASSHLQLA